MSNKLDSTPFEVARRKVARLPKLKGNLTNENILDILRQHFIYEVPKERVADNYDHLGPRDSIIRAMSKLQGKDTSRFQKVRAIFRQMCLELGMADPFTDYKSDQDKERIRRRKQSQRTLGVFDHD